MKRCPLLISLLLLSALAVIPTSPAAEPRPLLQGTVTKSTNEALEQAGIDRERGTPFSTNQPTERGKGTCPLPYSQPGTVPPVLVYKDDERRRCIWWRPNPGNDNGERPPTPPLASSGSPLAPAQPAPPRADPPSALPRPGSQPPQFPARRRQPTPEDVARDAFENVHGIADGVGSCLSSMIDALAGAGQFLAQDYEKAAMLWGLEPGQSVTLRAIEQEIRDTVQRPNLSPYESGKVSGRRLCVFGILPAAAKAMKQTTAVAKEKLKNAGSTRFNPVPRGPLLSQMATDTPHLLERKWIATPDGSVQLGPHVGKGTFGSVFEEAGGRQVVKISTTTTGSADTFPTQFEGSRTLQRIGVPTLKIQKMYPGKGEAPAILVMDKLRARYPDARFFTRSEYDAAPLAQRNEIRSAIAEAHIQVAANDFVLVDGHLGNIAFVPKPSGGYRAVIVDADMIVPGSRFARRLSDAGTAGDVMAGALARDGTWNALMRKQALGEPMPVSNAAGWTRLLMDSRFPRQGIPNDDTVPR